MWKSFKGFIKTFVDIVNDEREVNVDNWRRRNGWTWPPSVLQMLSWIALGFLIPISAILVAPLHPVFAPLFVILFAIWIIALIIVITSIDPAIRTLRPGTKPARFDRSKHLHVIENLYCNICLITVLFLLLVSSASLTAFTMASVLTVLPIYFLISGADIRKSGGMLLPTTWWQGLCAVVVFTDSTFNLCADIVLQGNKEQLRTG
ncbi:unnamed protein product [Anisakis simplex]|uniref:Palmitoyltransferase (inferred by orthology to a C. elegans protein) n=1 Tax=Anisakis simplex TaxID=6269 RepID=A0A0M3JZL2_ANISI|nr:unnamed protein product [Anisakis simplex]